MNRAIWSAAALLVMLAVTADAQTSARKQKPDSFPMPSRWNLTHVYPQGSEQGGFIRAENGYIYAANSITPGGTVAQNADGSVTIVFDGHRKIVNGRAVLRKASKGRWEGTLTQETGQTGLILKKQ